MFETVVITHWGSEWRKHNLVGVCVRDRKEGVRERERKQWKYTERGMPLMQGCL